MTYFVLTEGTCKYCSGPMAVRDLDHRTVCYNMCRSWITSEDLRWKMKSIGTTYMGCYTPWSEDCLDL